jgi:hypothetical protein
LNRAQQSNIANQLDWKAGWSSGWVTLVINLSGNTFHGADQSYAQSIADMIFSEFNKHSSLPWF